MNAQEEMQKIVEAAGECWHKWTKPPSMQCTTCSLLATPTSFKANPSPTDLNELFRLADKLGYDYHVGRNSGCIDVMIFDKQDEVIADGNSDNLADALRKSLVNAIEGSSK